MGHDHKDFEAPHTAEGRGLDLSTEEKDNYETVKLMPSSKLTPVSLVTLDEFHRWNLLPGEALLMFIHPLKKLLLQAVPDLNIYHDA